MKENKGMVGLKSKRKFCRNLSASLFSSSLSLIDDNSWIPSRTCMLSYFSIFLGIKAGRLCCCALNWIVRKLGDLCLSSPLQNGALPGLQRRHRELCQTSNIKCELTDQHGVVVVATRARSPWKGFTNGSFRSGSSYFGPRCAPVALEPLPLDAI